MNIPNSDRKRALIIVDVQDVFLNEENKHVLVNIEKLLNEVPYDMYINAVFYADEKSIWKKQLDWSVKKEQAKTVESIQNILNKKNKIFDIIKQTKSVFKGLFVNGNKIENKSDTNLQHVLSWSGIQEVHIIGLDTNDCVLATAYESFDMGFFTYVIEECVQSSGGNDIHESGIKLLRHVELTNNEN